MRSRSRLSADQVISLLEERFPDLAEEPVRGVVLRAVTDQLAAPDRSFEVILDHPSVANWRLRPHPDRADVFRVADYRLTAGAPDERVERINGALAG